MPISAYSESAFYLAIKNGKVESNPISLVKLAKQNKRVRFFTAEEQRLMKVMQKDYYALAHSERQ